MDALPLPSATGPSTTGNAAPLTSPPATRQQAAEVRAARRRSTVSSSAKPAGACQTMAANCWAEREEMYWPLIATLLNKKKHGAAAEVQAYVDSRFKEAQATTIIAGRDGTESDGDCVNEAHGRHRSREEHHVCGDSATGHRIRAAVQGSKTLQTGHPEAPSIKRAKPTAEPEAAVAERDVLLTLWTPSCCSAPETLQRVGHS